MLTLFILIELIVGLPNSDLLPQSHAPSSGVSQGVDLRGIWKGSKLDAKKAKARGLDPSAITTPIKLLNVPPTYPPAAQLARQTGMVRLECRIEADGSVRSCGVVRKVAPLLDAEALRVVLQWR